MGGNEFQAISGPGELEPPPPPASHGEQTRGRDANAEFVSPPVSTNRGRCAVFTLVGLAAALARVLTAPFRRRQGGEPDRVLLLEPYGMGDVLSLQPLMRALRRRHVGVTLCARASWAGLAGEAEIENFVPSEFSWSAYKTGAKYGRPGAFLRGIAAWLRRVRPLARGATGFDPRGDARSVLLLYLAGCRRVFTFERYYVAASCRMPRFAADRVLPVPSGRHRWEVNLALLPALLPEAEGANPGRPRLSVPDGAEGGLPESASWLGLIPMTPWPGKRWAPERWGELIERVRGDGWRPVALCGPGERDECARATGPGTPIIECAGIPAWLASLNRCRAVVSVNTGPMHLADALDVPIVLLEGSGQIPLWSPSGAATRVRHHQPEFPCAPCHQVGDPGCGGRCMQAIQPAEVVAALREIVTIHPEPIGNPGAEA